MLGLHNCLTVATRAHEFEYDFVDTVLQYFCLVNGLDNSIPEGILHEDDVFVELSNHIASSGSGVVVHEERMQRLDRLLCGLVELTVRKQGECSLQP